MTTSAPSTRAGAGNPREEPGPGGSASQNRRAKRMTSAGGAGAAKPKEFRAQAYVYFLILSKSNKSGEATSLKAIEDTNQNILRPRHPKAWKKETLNRGVPTASGGVSTICCKNRQPPFHASGGPIRRRFIARGCLGGPIGAGRFQQGDARRFPWGLGMGLGRHGLLRGGGVGHGNNCFAAKIPTPNAPGLFFEFKAKLTRLQRG